MLAMDLTPFAHEGAPLLADLKERRYQQWLELTVKSYKKNNDVHKDHDDYVISILDHLSRSRLRFKNSA